MGTSSNRSKSASRDAENSATGGALIAAARYLCLFLSPNRIAAKTENCGKVRAPSRRAETTPGKAPSPGPSVFALRATPNKPAHPHPSLRATFSLKGEGWKNSRAPEKLRAGEIRILCYFCTRRVQHVGRRKTTLRTPKGQVVLLRARRAKPRTLKRNAGLPKGTPLKPPIRDSSIPLR